MMVVAAIVAGEVGTTVPQARMLVACQVVQDAEEGRWLPGRWYGWGTPTAADVAAAERALFTNACERVPDCRFLGSDEDVRVWRWLRYIDRDASIYRVTNGQWASSCVMAHGWDEFFQRKGGPVPE